ncbi:hypothetical protein PsYK624_170570 [Phanerochaete sordida]|uniref:F-box domain-containing protein n=1 Tax=Phanerochaete sordida TaxID=48140 RepID=A0A9P3GYP3_9APHY|nr:hypothetical protein PsYK624_170570 [Phanerochaete sordida]
MPLDASEGSVLDYVPNELLTIILSFLIPSRNELTKVSNLSRRLRECALKVQGFFSHVYCAVTVRDDYLSFYDGLLLNPDLASSVRHITFLPTTVSTSSLTVALRKPTQPIIDEYLFWLSVCALPKLDRIDLVGLHWHDRAAQPTGRGPSRRTILSKRPRLRLLELHTSSLTIDDTSQCSFISTLSSLHVERHLHLGTFCLYPPALSVPPVAAPSATAPSRVTLSLRPGDSSFATPTSWNTALAFAPAFTGLRSLRVDHVRGCDVAAFQRMLNYCSYHLEHLHFLPANPGSSPAMRLVQAWRQFSLTDFARLHTVAIGIPFFPADNSIASHCRSQVMQHLITHLPVDIAVLHVNAIAAMHDGDDIDATQISIVLTRVCHEAFVNALATYDNLVSFQLGLGWAVDDDLRSWTPSMQAAVEARLANLPGIVPLRPPVLALSDTA